MTPGFRRTIKEAQKKAKEKNASAFGRRLLSTGLSVVDPQTVFPDGGEN